jgi:MFS family permease
MAFVGNARLAGFERDLGLKGYDYNSVLSIFFISYILFEIPSNMACKYLGPGWFIPAITLGFGICSMCTAFVHDLRSAYGVRFLLGMFESGMLPGIAYYMSRWYRHSELAFRLSVVRMPFILSPNPVLIIFLSTSQWHLSLVHSVASSRAGSSSYPRLAVFTNGGCFL